MTAVPAQGRFKWVKGVLKFWICEVVDPAGRGSNGVAGAGT